jgi:hypothetical protein
MFCYKCGEKLPDDALFCLKCGTKTPNPGDKLSAGGAVGIVTTKRKFKPLGRAALVLCSCAAILAMTVLFWPKGLPNSGNFTSFLPQQSDVTLYGLKMSVAEGDWANPDTTGFIATNCQESKDFVTTSAQGKKIGGLSFDESGASDSYFLWTEFVKFPSENSAKAVLKTVIDPVKTHDCDNPAGYHTYTGSANLLKSFNIQADGAYIADSYKNVYDDSYGKDLMVIVRRGDVLAYIMIHHPSSSMLGDESDKDLISLSIKKFVG